MNRREKVLFILLGGLIVAGGLWYYFNLRQAVAPENSQTATTSRQQSGDAPELESQVVVAGLNNPWDIVFLPDGTTLFTERSGTISKVVENNKSILHTADNVQAVGEGGLMGLAVDPDFEDNRFIYACYNTAEDIRVSRWKVNEDVTELAEQTDIVTGMPVNTTSFPGRHSGCRPSFGPEGNLWIGTGDVAIGPNPQDPKSLGGKILRVDRDGQPVAGNLSAPFDLRVFSYGHRNTQGLAFFATQKDGAFGYSIEHGPDRDDEVNLLVPGNFGWDPVPGYNEAVPMTDTEKFPEAVEAVWPSGSETIAPAGATIISGKKWQAWENCLAIAVLKDEHLRLLDFDVSGRNVLDEQQLFTNEFGRLRSVVMGPDNGLYLTTDNGGNRDQIIRVTPK